MSIRMINNVRTVPAELLKFSKNNNEAAFYLSENKISKTSPKTLIDCYSNIRLIGNLLKKSNLNISEVENTVKILALFDDSIRLSTYKMKSTLLALLHPTKRLGFGYKNIKVKFVDQGSVLYKNINLLTEKRFLGDLQVGKNINFIYNGKIVKGQISDIYSILIKAFEADERDKQLFHTLFEAQPFSDDVDLQSQIARIKDGENYEGLSHYTKYVIDHA